MKKSYLALIAAVIISVAGVGTYRHNSSEDAPVNLSGEETLSVHYIDVGQGDSEFIRFPDGRNMLIDAGTSKAGEELLSYLDSQKVQRIDYLIATHPHADHIGSMSDVVKKYDIGEIYMPKAAATTKTYENLLTEIDKKGLSINTARANVDIINENGLSAIILAPNSQSYEDLNNYSAVVKLVYGNNSFLFTGDAEDISENEMLSAYADLKSDILKIGHHGSHSSTTDAFLDAVSPAAAIISCGKDNSYGHPHTETLNALSKRNITVYRTDQDGSIVLDCDGKTIQKR
jgi:beta-lactamase superfamily II metal-dependent hydrolase